MIILIIEFMEIQVCISQRYTPKSSPKSSYRRESYDPNVRKLLIVLHFSDS
jgi:hypothetical protein